MSLSHKIIFGVLFLVLGLTIFSLTIVAGLEPPKSTTVYYQGKNGQDGIDGSNGLNGKNALSQIFTNDRTHTIVQTLPINGKDGKDSEPCTTFTEEETGDTIIKCPDGTSSRIQQPKDGLNAPPNQIRVNPTNGNIEQKLGNSSFWTVLLLKCQYQGTC